MSDAANGDARVWMCVCFFDGSCSMKGELGRYPLYVRAIQSSWEKAGQGGVGVKYVSRQSFGYGCWMLQRVDVQCASLFDIILV